MTCGQSVRGVAALLVALAWLGTAPAQSAAQGANLRVLSSNGVHAVLDEIVPQCERAIARSVTIEYGTSASIRQRVSAGEAVDVVFATTEVAGELAAAGHVAADSRKALGRSGIGIGIRAGARHPDIATPAALKQTLLAAKSVTYAQDGASRVHIERMFEQLGITTEMKAKTLLEQGSVRAAAKVVAGEAELLFTLVSEILPVEGMELVGPLPAEFQSYVSFAAALGARTTSGDAARALVECVAAPAAAATFAAKGVER
ncbi:MAG TPA: substrate-binding domain-containing protein [Gammaproteobacteria bacterium]|nr:substrate-binding domain-containing protein [Gammaproteobacteria bacterium]